MQLPATFTFLTKNGVLLKRKRLEYTDGKGVVTYSMDDDGWPVDSEGQRLEGQPGIDLWEMPENFTGTPTLRNDYHLNGLYIAHGTLFGVMVDVFNYVPPINYFQIQYEALNGRSWGPAIDQAIVFAEATKDGVLTLLEKTLVPSTCKSCKKSRFKHLYVNRGGLCIVCFEVRMNAMVEQSKDFQERGVLTGELVRQMHYGFDPSVPDE